MVYVASSIRPIHELLAPNVRFDENLYDHDFAGMTQKAVTKDALIDTQMRYATIFGTDYLEISRLSCFHSTMPTLTLT